MFAALQFGHAWHLWCDWAHYRGVNALCYVGAVDAEAQPEVLMILESADSLLQMLNDLLDLTKLESGKCPLALQTCMQTFAHMAPIPAGTMRPEAHDVDLRLFFPTCLSPFKAMLHNSSVICILLLYDCALP
jgi:signal transduction histidine kinase